MVHPLPRRTLAAFAMAAALPLTPAHAGAPAGRQLTPGELFNYAEAQYPALFPAHAVNQSAPPYTYRYYPATGHYLGVADQKVFLLGPASGGSVKQVGVLDDFYCAVQAQECGSSGLPVLSSDAMMDLATRGIDALFLYEAVINSIVFDMLDSVARTTVSGRPAAPIAGTQALPCVNGGTGSYTVTDADDSHTLTPGDRISLTASHCILTSLTNHPPFSGRIDITVTGGVNTHNYWASTGDTGSIELRVDLQNLDHFRGLLNGTFGYASSWPDPGADYTFTTTFEDLVAKTSDGSTHYTDVRLNFSSDSHRLTSADGAVTVDSSRGGQRRLQLSVAEPLVVVQDTIRPRPTSGVLRASGHGFQIDVRYAENRQMTVSLDNGPDGRIEQSGDTNEARMDGFLNYP